MAKKENRKGQEIMRIKPKHWLALTLKQRIILLQLAAKRGETYGN